MARLLRWLGLFAASWLGSCQPAEPPASFTPAFYYWRTTFNPTHYEKDVLKKAGVQKLYVRFFDVDWDEARNGVMPKARIQFAEQPAGLTIVPVVFVTNRTMQRLPAGKVPELARNMVAQIRPLARSAAVSPGEIQLDCDWTVGTRARYFDLVRAVKQAWGGPVSVTIRLHQIKFFERTGVPPADRGMLMAYNLADWQRVATQNSIFDNEILARYLDRLPDYPLPLDVVLPVFHWTVVFRNGRFLMLLNHRTAGEWAAMSFLKAVPNQPTRFVAQRDTLALGFSVRRGDLFRAEAVSIEALTQGKRQIFRKIRNQTGTFALYHLDSSSLAAYPDATLASLLPPAP